MGIQFHNFTFSQKGNLYFSVTTGTADVFV